MTKGKLLWRPDERRVREANITAYAEWLRSGGRKVEGYASMWEWSVGHIEEFWQTIWDYFKVDPSEPYRSVLRERRMPGAAWFEGSELNFARHVFRNRREGPALLAGSEDGEERLMSWAELEKRAGALVATLRGAGVRRGDRVGAVLPNSIEAVVAFLACASMGAVWSCCSPDFGAPAILDRFRQIRPKVLIATRGYSYGGRRFNREDALASVLGSLRGLRKVIIADDGPENRAFAGSLGWGEATDGNERLKFVEVPFDHPLWILYSSGTTGLPKPIVHGHGGILVEELKELSLHNDIRPGDRFLWFTTTGWMMWNYLIGGLLRGATLALYDGSPVYPEPDSLWGFAERAGVSFMGVSAPYVSACMKASIEPRSAYDLRRLRGIGSTGSPLPAEGFEWVYSKVKEDVWLASLSGGTDVCTAFVGGCPTLPVYSGEIQCRCLGAKVEAYDEGGRSVVGKVGELVVTEPMPSMPLYLWGDADGKRYMESYFDIYPGVWRHGDWIEITKRGTCVIYGRSDATIKRQGVRIGTSEIYRAVESLPLVSDSLAVDVVRPDGRTALALFVVLEDEARLDERLATMIRNKVRSDLSPRYVPDEIVQVEKVPRTLSGKKLEVPVKRIFAGVPASQALNRDSLADPSAARLFERLAKRMRTDGKL